jgi:hypothetical protein
LVCRVQMRSLESWTIEMLTFALGRTVQRGRTKLSRDGF